MKRKYILILSSSVVSAILFILLMIYSGWWLCAINWNSGFGPMAKFMLNRLPDKLVMISIGKAVASVNRITREQSFDRLIEIREPNREVALELLFDQIRTRGESGLMDIMPGISYMVPIYITPNQREKHKLELQRQIDDLIKAYESTRIVNVRMDIISIISRYYEIGLDYMPKIKELIQQLDEVFKYESACLIIKNIQPKDRELIQYIIDYAVKDHGPDALWRVCSALGEYSGDINGYGDDFNKWQAWWNTEKTDPKYDEYVKEEAKRKATHQSI
jgi:hypothetical protein